MAKPLRIVLLIAILLFPPWAGVRLDASPPDKPAADEDKAPTTKLVLHPMAAPRPALRYQLLPPFLDRRPGNAAVCYNKVPAKNTYFFSEFRKQWEKIDKWQATPLSDPREKELRKGWEQLVSEDGRIFEHLDQGARCESCDWQLPIRDHEFYNILLPDIQQSRTYARLLAAKARIQFAVKKFDAAERSLQTGYALGRHVSQGPCFVMPLVGLAICGIMSKDVEDWAQQPGSPNLYWALTYLPRPLIDLRPALEGEFSAVYLSYPDLRNLDTAQYSPEQWRRLLDKTIADVNRWQDDRPAKPQPLITTVAALRGYPMAKRALVAWGRSAAEVEAMPVAQVIMLYTMRTFDEFRDDIFKWSSLPYPESHAGLTEAFKRLYDARQEGREVFPLADTLVPAVEAIQMAAARGDRTIAMLRVIEAIRLHGASHEGRLPEDLADIKEVPIPIDPITAKPFTYQRADDRAFLESPYIPGQSQRAQGVRYEITFAQKGN